MQRIERIESIFRHLAGLVIKSQTVGTHLVFGIVLE